MEQRVAMRAFETRSLCFAAFWRVSFQAPVEDVDRIMDHVTAIAPLVMGKYDRCAYQSAPGTERYRPLAGAAAGAEDDTRLRPDVVEVSFQITREEALLAAVAEAIYAVHSYEEPVIAVEEILASRSLGRDDKNNPHRWWNQGGDWKAKTVAG